MESVTNTQGKGSALIAIIMNKHTDVLVSICLPIIGLSLYPPGYTPYTYSAYGFAYTAIIVVVLWYGALRKIPLLSEYSMGSHVLLTKVDPSSFGGVASFLKIELFALIEFINISNRFG